MIVTMDLTHFAPMGSAANVTSTQTKAVLSLHRSVRSKPLGPPASAAVTVVIVMTRTQVSVRMVSVWPVSVMAMWAVMVTDPSVSMGPWVVCVLNALRMPIVVIQRSLFVQMVFVASVSASPTSAVLSQTHYVLMVITGRSVVSAKGIGTAPMPMRPFAQTGNAVSVRSGPTKVAVLQHQTVCRETMATAVSAVLWTMIVVAMPRNVSAETALSVTQPMVVAVL